MATEGKPEVGSDVKSEALDALNQESAASRSRRRRSFEDVQSESTSSTPSATSTSTAMATETPERETASKSRRAPRKPQEYIAQYKIAGMKDRDPEVPSSGRHVTFQPGDFITVEECGGEPGLARLMSTGFVVTRAVWDAKMAAFEAEAVAREALADAKREQAEGVEEAAID